VVARLLLHWLGNPDLAQVAVVESFLVVVGVQLRPGQVEGVRTDLDPFQQWCSLVHLYNHRTD